MNDQKVYILLAAYNGSCFIRQQIDSVLQQDHENIRLILSDDGSQDGTQAILAEYAEQYPDRVQHYRSGIKFGCAQKHFLQLLSVFRDAPYIMFCDQDDVWHSDKVSKTLDRMLKLETEEAVPALVHTDLRVVDENLEEICPSFWRYSNLDGSRMALNQLLVQNVVTGCTMMINRSLAVQVCKTLPEQGILMHDWWIALVASACGRTDVIREATLDYRQHGTNSVGAKNVRSAAYLWNRLTSASMRSSLRNAAAQAAAFLECYADILNGEQTLLLTAFVESQEKSLPAKNAIYLRFGLIKYGIVRKIAQFLGL